MSVMQIVRRADAHIVDALRLIAATQLFDVPIKPLKFGKEANFVGILIEQAYRIARVDGYAQRRFPVSRIALRCRGAMYRPRQSRQNSCSQSTSLC